MGKTFSCTFKGCSQIFSREFQLKKHRVAHDDPDSVHHCSYCEYFTLDPRNLQVHIATHTGEKKYTCPGPITDPSESSSSGSPVEGGCEYRTNDMSLLTKHRRRVHDYIPRRRASPRRDTVVAFIPYTVRSSAATENTTSHVTKSKSKRAKRNATTKCSKYSRTRATGEADDSIDSSFPAALREGVDATGSSYIGSNSAVPLISNEHALLGVHGHQAYVGWPDATSTFSAGPSGTTSVVPNEGISLHTSHAAGPSSSTLVAPNQGISAEDLLNPATSGYWSWLYADDFAGPSTSNFQTDTYATGGFQTATDHYGLGTTAWDAFADNFWGGYNSFTTYS